MANRKVRIVRDVKLNGKWTSLSLKKAQKLKIPAAEGRWYITWREGRRIKREQARDHGQAIELQGKKHAELHATAFGIKITPDNPNRMRLEKAFDDFIEDQELLQASRQNGRCLPSRQAHISEILSATSFWIRSRGAICSNTRNICAGSRGYPTGRSIPAGRL